MKKYNFSKEKNINIASERTNAKLREVFKHWISAAENYSDAEGFRIAINSCIQAVRNVTFILQSNKKEIEQFDVWYEDWRTAMVADPIMKWCVDARNYIVKKGDLETLSIARVELLNSHIEKQKNIFSIDPLLTGVEIAKYIKEKFLPDALKGYGYLRVERQWITKDLEGVELLSGLAHAFTVLKLMIDDIEVKAGPESVYKSEKLKENDFSAAIEFIDDSDKPECMLAFEEYRTTNYHLSADEATYLTTEVIALDEKYSPELELRYGDIKSTIGKMGDSLEERVDYHLKIAKGILKVDKYLLTTVAIFDSDDKPHMISIGFQDNETKYIFWKDIAKRVKKLRATMIITTGDSWRAKLDESHQLKLGQSISDLSEKKEGLMACGMTRAENVITIVSPYVRDNEMIIFNDDEKILMQPNFLNPVLKAFKKLKRP